MTVAIYCRVSTLEQQQRKTIDSQRAEVGEYCKTQGLEIVRDFMDDGVSGGVLERPGLDKLRDECKTKDFEGIVCHHPDRLSRDQLHQLLLVSEFESAGKKLMF